jgi:16S rRNA (cytidine1402-2'-O)-methyltransferase
MPGTLFLVATPIGNLEDVTLRAIRVLREVDLIAAEDTRRTARLLAHHGIETPSTSFHEHNVRSRLPQLLARLERGEQIAVVTDAGTPSISDPGLELVQACIERQIAIDPIPGPSAPLAAAVVSGFPLSPWTIFGFPPSRGKDRKAWFAAISVIPHTICFFEAPHRMGTTLDELGVLLVDRPIMLGRELTKAHQEFLRGTASELATRLGSPRGEFTVVVGPQLTQAESVVDASDESLASEFCHLTEMLQIGRRAAISDLAKRHHRAARDIYAALERHKHLANDQ